MNLDNYRNFRVIVEMGSLAAAAKKLHLAQSALSSQLKTFEEKFGAELIIKKRGVRRVLLTEAGKALYEKSGYICKLDETVLSQIQALKGGTEGNLIISLSPSMSTDLIKGYLSGFGEIYPKVRFELYEVPVTELENQLLYGLSEIGVACAPLQQAEAFEIIYQDWDVLAAVYPYENKWKQFLEEKNLSLASLANIPLNLSRGCLPTFEKACKEFGLQPEILSVNTTKMSTIMWARQGAGIAIVPVSKSDNFDDFLCCKAIEIPKLSIKKTVVVAKNHALSPIAKAFLNYCSKLDKQWKIPRD